MKKYDTYAILDETVGHATSRLESDLDRYRDTHTEQLRSLSKCHDNNSDHITYIILCGDKKSKRDNIIERKTSLSPTFSLI